MRLLLQLLQLYVLLKTKKGRKVTKTQTHSSLIPHLLSFHRVANKVDFLRNIREKRHPVFLTTPQRMC
jgi:hypothetical protein